MTKTTQKKKGSVVPSKKSVRDNQYKTTGKIMSKKERCAIAEKHQDELEEVMFRHARFALGHTAHTIPSIKGNFEMSIDNVLGWLATDNQAPVVSEERF
tara:strand:- start:329 stop:625 length:297 start_codon:yes stop_codon:yes gene_type:complete